MRDCSGQLKRHCCIHAIGVARVVALSLPALEVMFIEFGCVFFFPFLLIHRFIDDRKLLSSCSMTFASYAEVYVENINVN